MVGKWEEMYRWDDGVNVSFLRHFCLLSLAWGLERGAEADRVQYTTAGSPKRPACSHEEGSGASLFPWILHSPSLCPQLFPLGTQWENLS